MLFHSSVDRINKPDSSLRKMYVIKTVTTNLGIMSSLKYYLKYVIVLSNLV